MNRIVVWLVCGVVVIGGATMFWGLGSSGNGMGSTTKSTRFVSGGTNIIRIFAVGPEGGTFEVGAVGTPIDGTTIKIPTGSITVSFLLSVGYNSGKLELVSGIASNVFLVLSADQMLTFGKYITVGVHFIPMSQYRAVVGYSIEPGGQLRPIDLINADMRAGNVSFAIFKPATVTWVYIE